MELQTNKHCEGKDKHFKKALIDPFFEERGFPLPRFTTSAFTQIISLKKDNLIQLCGQ